MEQQKMEGPAYFGDEVEWIVLTKINGLWVKADQERPLSSL